MKHLWAVSFLGLMILYNGTGAHYLVPEICSTKGISCYDNFTIQNCASTGESGLRYTVSCQVQNPDRPYCFEYGNRVECVPDFFSTPELEPKISKICNQQGSRPDPLNCSHFIQCKLYSTSHMVDWFGNVVNCPSDTVYDIESGDCRQDGSCSTIHSLCTGNEDKLVAYPPYPSLYVKCPAKDSLDDIIVNLCEKPVHNFNEKSGACQPICRKEGPIENYKNCKTFYECIKTGGDLFNLSTHICPAGTGFNYLTNFCDERNADCSLFSN